MKKQNIRIGSMTISLLIVAVLTFTCVALARAASPYVGPDDYGYSAYEIPANLRDISASGTVVPLDNNPTYPSDLDDQDEISAISIPFPFDFYGISYTKLYISSNGFITFTADTDAGCCSGRPLPQNDTWNNLIALFWEDLSRPEGNIRYQTLGTPGNREFVIGFYSVPHDYDHHHVTFEAILHEATGDIELQYGEAPGDGETHSVGIENADGTIGLEIAFGDVSFSNQGFLITTGFVSSENFEVKGSVALDEYSDGIDPVNEDVSITVGSVTFEFPAGSFAFDEKRSQFEFEGDIDGADVNVVLKQPDFDTLDFVFQANGVDFFQANNTEDIILTVGLDTFSTQIRVIPAKPQVLDTWTGSGLNKESVTVHSNNNPVKVFILAGQSNMVGKGKIDPTRAHLDKNGGQGTLRYLINDATQNSKYDHLVDASGNWSERNDVWLVDLNSSGPLTVKNKTTFGPQLQFAHVVADHYKNNQVLIIKTAWGGKSLYADFRPPGSRGTVGPYYTKMIDRVHEVLNDIENFYPNYQGQGYEIVGFGWHQGWNDRINLTANTQYQENCVNLINDLRQEFNLPDMPFVLATTGMKGWSETNGKALSLMNAQLAVPNDNRLNNQSNVVAVETRDFWRDESISPTSQGYHWNTNAETYFLIGKAMGKAMVALLPEEGNEFLEENGLIYEAEDYTKKNGVIFKSRNAGFTGTGYMDFGGDGTWIKWNNIHISNAGEYTLVFRYANGGSKRQCAIIKNGRNVGNVAFKNTGGGKIWKTDSIVVRLPKGINKIKVKANTANGGPNLDHMKILGLYNNDDQDNSDTVDECDKIDAVAIANSKGTSYSASIENKVKASISALTKHIKGVNTLSNSAIKQHKSTIDSNIDYLGYSKEMIVASMNLIETYETIIGPFFMNEFTKNLTRSELPPNIHAAILSVMQGAVDNVYTDENVKKCYVTLKGSKFKSSEHFPGKVTSIPNPNEIHTAKINGSYKKTFGHLVMHAERPARKPTGTYLAPGSIATVTVPNSLVGKGYQIRIGAQCWDLFKKPGIKRLDRSSIVYDIKNTATKVASPLGGGIYIEVPYRANAGIVNVKIKNAVRSPYFSMKSFHKTSLSDWRNIERKHGAPWADFQTDKFMMQVPTSWIYNYDDPTKALTKWDKAMDAVSDLMGFPRIRGKESLYLQVDVTIRAKAYSPGYPQVNTKFTPLKEYNGNEDKFFLKGPPNLWEVTFHEMGHGQKFQKFPGETESAVNLPHVAVMHQKFGMSLDTAFQESCRNKTEFQTLDNTAIFWMLNKKFKLEQPMEKGDMKYQLKGHAKYVEVARLFGWEVLNDYWYSINKAYENGVTIDTSINGLILRMSKSAGIDLSPLIHFWGMHPNNVGNLKTAIKNANLQPSRKVYDMLVKYKSILPKSNQSFRNFAENWWRGKPSSGGGSTESYHSVLWNSYDLNSSNVIKQKVKKIVNLYFPNGRP